MIKETKEAKRLFDKYYNKFTKYQLMHAYLGTISVFMKDKQEEVIKKHLELIKSR